MRFEVTVMDDGAHMTLAAVDDREIVQDQWILDSGLSLHLVNDTRLLESSRDRDSECTLPDGNFVCHEGRAGASQINCRWQTSHRSIN